MVFLILGRISAIILNGVSCQQKTKIGIEGPCIWCCNSLKFPRRSWHGISLFILYILRFTRRITIVRVTDGQTMYFQNRSPPIFEKCYLVSTNFTRYKIKISQHGNFWDDFYSLAAMHQKTHSFASITHSFFYALQLVNKNLSCAFPME